MCFVAGKTIHSIFIIFSISYFLFPVIATAAIEQFGVDYVKYMCRKPEVVADAAHMVFSRTNCEVTGQLLVDDDVLKDGGVADMDQYAHCKCVRISYRMGALVHTVEPPTTNLLGNQVEMFVTLKSSVQIWKR